ncbi:catalase family peroxidase [Asticcacaulis sp. SL142]|uniref:catalase family peroxidase n=1 Tax=Asticcacaulis sp. SL142 TaxID=2995155 RepID=UPI00226C680B|nr:catalase family peroxidase [Asticcacaulis sp. SL142]WAC48283.1 catalase family peroxidase [Asticcacaulis sp. SL142]
MLDSKSALPALGAIGAIVAVLILGFGWARGWLGPTRVSGAAIADALEGNAGKHAGHRRAHAKGMCVTGYFDSNGNGRKVSTATVFKPGRYPVVGRFSLGGGNPLARDGRNVFHALALRIVTPDRQEWRLAMDHTDIFPVATPQAFVALQKASTPLPATGQPDPAVMKAYLAEHPETKAFQDYMKTNPLPGSFATGPYHSINAFRFTDAQAQHRFVRWSFQPEASGPLLDKANLNDLPKDFLFDEMKARLKQGPVAWRMVVTLAAPDDVTDNATVRWPAGRRQLETGRLVIDRAEPQSGDACRDLNFDPTVLPPGIAISDDPLLAARAAAYSASFTRRAGETPPPSNGAHS